MVKFLKFFFRLLKNPIDKSLRIRFYLMKGICTLLIPQYRFKWPQQGWWADREFNEYLKRFNEIKGLNTDRRWMLYQLMRLTEAVPGDTAECGVYKGASSYLICRINQEAKNYNRLHFGFDSFEGLSKPTSWDGTYWKKYDLSCTLDETKTNLSELDNFIFHKGWIPEKFKELENRRFSFVHIDVDIFEPTRDSIEFFYPLMNEGGIILCDDYGFTCCPGATEAIDNFLEDKLEKIISFSCGGGFLIKGCQTSASLKI